MSRTRYVTFDAARPQVKDHGVAHGSTGTSIRRYFGPQGIADADSEGYRVDVQPGVEHRAHFHHVEQFQVFCGSSETVHQGRKTGPLLVQYTDADTMYGPFAAGGQPYKYFTMRKDPSVFTGFVPEDRDELRLGRKKRHVKSDLREWLAGSLPASGAVAVEGFQKADADGLAAFAIAAGPGGTFQTPIPGAGGQYQLVVEGSANDGDEGLPAFTMGYFNLGDVAPELIAGPSGARLLILQFGGE